ncbi:exo-alpha-sialidase [Streptomyces sp. WMMC500]|uniref:sialidase family protein n=1 Tax=Streptomyces sp. WMMC500 TaxID=3015154 RepID=UPI00248CFEA3|nr:sialidase family protein [Streptomyces sp. WMMC500]WBB59307.1 exo-alpha-sialidase [Streptomyces sp. WMMC500]
MSAPPRPSAPQPRRGRGPFRAAGPAACALLLAGAVPAAALPAAQAPDAAAGSGSRPTARIAYSTVFERGEDGYHSFRIPAVVEAADGTLLAFAEGRVAGAGDDGDIDLVLKRSPDGGRTWGELDVVADDGGNKFGNPVPVVDRATGRVLLNTTRTGGGVSGQDVICGRATAEETRRSFVQHSDDHGATWSDPREITADVKRPEWRHFVGGPGHGTQLTRGAHAGRLVIPGNHSRAPEPGGACPDDRLFGGHALYSDDGGGTWHLGGVDEVTDGTVIPNETSATELSDGTVYFNTRDQHGSSPGARAATVSGDGGATFDAPYREVPDLLAPVVQGAVLTLPAASDPAGRLVFSAPRHATARENLTLRTSRDDGAAWREGPQVHDGPAGYSDLVPAAGGVGVLYENGDRTPTGDGLLPYHRRITYAHVPARLLSTPPPRPSTTPDASGHRHHSVVSGSPERVRGVSGRALELSGDYVETPLTGELAFDEGPFTAAAWFRSTEREQQQAVLWAHSEEAADAKWWIRLEPDQNRIRGHVNTGSQNTFVSAPGDFADGEWHHVALTRDDTGITLYVDGAPAAASGPVAGSVSADARTGIRAGARVNGINNPLVGAVDEVWLFDRALDAAQTERLAADNRPPRGAAVLHLPLETVRRG